METTFGERIRIYKTEQTVIACSIHYKGLLNRGKVHKIEKFTEQFIKDASFEVSCLNFAMYPISIRYCL